MPATIRALLRRRDIGLTLLASEGSPSIQTPIRWVATSELVDPTPFLRGGELLLTTGMRLPHRREGTEEYVARLVRTGMVGLAVGVGSQLALQAVPPRLVQAADAAGLPLLLVDEPTPFIAIGEAVAQMQRADETAALAHAVHAQQLLTRAAVTRGRDGVVRQLAVLLRCWVLVTDAEGAIVASARGAGHGTPWQGVMMRVRTELARMRADRLASAAVAEVGRYVSVHALGDGSRAFLVIGREDSTAPDHAITAVAAALLTVAGGVPEGGATAGGEPAAWQVPGGGIPATSARGAMSAAAETNRLLDPLDGLRPRTRETLKATLHSWLAHHGSYESTAAALRIHRNTARYRIARAREVLGRDLDDATVRIELWFALGARQPGPLFHEDDRGLVSAPLAAARRYVRHD